ncbi:Imm58 family immunity protein [Paracidovorax avenae]|uniref:Imm58 family immunity protein n=1 Tax=Paracidovorax avenae TaxID=80867 RepID=UPI00128EBA6D|nr:Imm58 family immunity protein [Paracidovorax avenae]
MTMQPMLILPKDNQGDGLMQKSVLILAISCLVLFTSNIILGYFLIDRSITLSYVKASDASTARSLSILQLTLLHEWKGKSKIEIIKEIQKISDNIRDFQAITKIEGDTVWLDDIPMAFAKDRLIKIGDKEISRR